MSEQEKKPIPSADVAMEGRKIVDGKDLGDKDFFERGFAFDHQAEQEGLEALKKEEIELAEAQAEAFAARDASFGISAYEGLMKIYPNHPNKVTWEKRIAELKATGANK